MTNEAFTPSPASQETPQDTFGIEMRYNLNFLYHYLTGDNYKHTISLDNNLSTITDEDYDILKFPKIELTSDLKVKTNYHWPNRTDKTLSVNASLDFGSPLHFTIQYDEKTVPALMDALSSQGINTECNDDYRNGLPKRSGRYARILELKGAQPLDKLMLYLETTKDWSDTYYTTVHSISFRQPTIDLQSKLDIYTAITADITMMEKVIRVFYQMEKKHVPTEKLVFAPKQTKEELQKWFATCPNCRRQYSIVNGPDCPGCGGSNPIIHYHD